jgi:tetratricopeptide (TPR) repeat protein
MSRACGTFAAVAVAALLAHGCGDPVLWQRYRIERMLWNARRDVDRLDPSSVSSDDGHRAERELESIAAAFPARRWVGEHAPRSRYTADVAENAGQARLTLARLVEASGRERDAERLYAETIADFAGVPDVVREAGVARALRLEWLGEEAVAIDQWLDLWKPSPDLAPPATPESPVQAARLMDIVGRGAEASALRRDADPTLERAAVAAAGSVRAPRLWRALADLRTGAGHGPSARDALRRALAEPHLGRLRPDVLIALVESARGDARPESVRTYADAVERGPDWAQGEWAMREVARAWEAAGIADSALAVYKRLADWARPGGDVEAEAHFGQGRMLERLGRWELARSEYRALAAADPSNAFALASLVRIVRYHREHGEPELADTEGRHALETMNQLIATQRDENVLARTRRARGELLEWLDRPRDAFQGYTELWERSPGLLAAADGAARAATLADSAFADTSRAGVLLRDLAERGPTIEIRRWARREIARRTGSRG